MFITEIFKSIQVRERGGIAVRVCAFDRMQFALHVVRYGVCVHGGKKMSVDEVMERVEELAGGEDVRAGGTPFQGKPALQKVRAVPLVELTGGEHFCRKRFIRWRRSWWRLVYRDN